MHTDARQLDNQSIIEGDICIVGSGAAGLSIALEWLNTNYKVIVLEGGGFEYDDKVQELYNGKITGHAYFPMKSSRLHYFGGTTGHWGGMCSTFDEIDFQKRDWVEHSGWPIKREEFATYYPRACPILDLASCEWDISYWKKQLPLFAPMPVDKEILWNKIWQYSPPTRFGSKYKDAIVNAPNIHLYTYANVVDINATENIGAVKEVTVKNYAGKQHTVRAKYFILACCAIQNARILLASNKQATAGLGNGNDLVGRYFMEHPEIKTGELWLTESRVTELYKNDKKVRAEIAMTSSKQQEEKILNATVSLNPLLIAGKMESTISIWSDKDPRKSQDKWKKYYDKTYEDGLLEKLIPQKEINAVGLYTRSEQSPNPASRVMLSNEKDSLGVPRADLKWTMSPLDKKTIRKLNHILGQQVGAAGIGRVKLADFLLDESDDSMPDSTGGGWHHMGTTRMSDDPKTGVVDTNCKVHGIDNLYIAGSACFPTSGAVNPTLNIVAISLRLSDHIKELIKT